MHPDGYERNEIDQTFLALQTAHVQVAPPEGWLRFGDASVGVAIPGTEQYGSKCEMNEKNRHLTLIHSRGWCTSRVQLPKANLDVSGMFSVIGAVACIPIAPSRPTPACKFNRWTGHHRVYKVCAHEKLPTGIGCRTPERRAHNAPHQAAISKAYARAGSQLRPPRPPRRGPGPPPPPRIGSSAGVGRRAGGPPRRRCCRRCHFGSTRVQRPLKNT